MRAGFSTGVSALMSPSPFAQLHYGRMEVRYVHCTLAIAKDDELGRIETRQGQGRLGKET